MRLNNETCLVYLAFNSRKLYNEIAFNILTLFYHLSGDLSKLSIVIFTDNDKFFKRLLKNFPISYEFISKVDIEQAVGQHNYFYRLKPVILKRCLQKYNQNIFYLDGDTFFLKNPIPLLNKISKETSVMNSDEFDFVEGGEFEDSNWLGIRKALKNHTFLYKGNEIEIPLSTRMWNSGVTGISKHNTYLLDSIIEILDQVYSKARIFNTEQFAISFVLQNDSTIVSSEDYILHYWKDWGKLKFDYHFELFFKKNVNLPIDELAKRAYLLTLESENLAFPSPSIFKELVRRSKMIASVILRGRP